MVDDSLTSAWSPPGRIRLVLPAFLSSEMPSRRRTSKDGPAKLAKRMSAAGAWCSFATRVSSGHVQGSRRAAAETVAAVRFGLDGVQRRPLLVQELAPARVTT